MSSTVHHSFEFLLLDGFSNLVLASALEPLRDVRLRAAFASLDWDIATLDGRPAVSSSQIRVEPDHEFDPKRKGRTLVIVAGYQMREQFSGYLAAALRQARHSGDRIVALDTASWLLAEAGLLDGHQATIHWHEFNAFTERFPNVDVSKARFVQSGQFWTCGGASTTMDLVLDLIHQLFGPAAAFDALSMFIYDPDPQASTQQDPLRLHDLETPKLLEALNVIAQNVETPLTTFELAECVSLSERTLCRLFTRELGMTPGKYAKLFRLKHARYLAQETRLTIEQIALRCGFSCGSSLGRSYRSVFGQPLTAMR